jgi:hypothetical protein
VKRFLLGLILSGCATAAPTSWKTEPSPSLDDRFFPARSAWRGGDAVYSVPLSNERILWLFGDSFIAKPGVTVREGSKMVRNSLAIETVGGPLDFFWRTEKDQPADALKCPVDGHFLWPLSGLRAGPRLHLFLLEMQNKGEGAFGFATVRNLLASVENPDDSADRWKIDYSPIPASTATMDFGAASVVTGDHAYVYGNRHRLPRHAETIVARAPKESIGDFTLWRFWNGRDWVKEVGEAGRIFDAQATEMSVSYLASTRAFVAVTSGGFLSPNLLVSEAPRPEGPWSAPVTVFTCPEVGWKKDYFCYAGKAHPELDPTGHSLVISYACNSFSFADAVQDLRIYRPRFVVARLE